VISLHAAFGKATQKPSEVASSPTVGRLSHYSNTPRKKASMVNPADDPIVEASWSCTTPRGLCVGGRGIAMIFQSQCKTRFHRYKNNNHLSGLSG
jgi:hypothetical protein